MTTPQDNLAFDQTRLDKIRALKDKGITIFPSSFDREHTVLYEYRMQTSPTIRALNRYQLPEEYTS